MSLLRLKDSHSTIPRKISSLHAKYQLIPYER